MTGMKTITATEFKAKCFELLENLPAEGMAISKRGTTVARIFPAKGGVDHLIGSVPNLHIEGDLYSTGLKWDAES